MQHDDLKAFGCERIYTDKVSGVRVHKPEFDKLRDYIRPGDTLVVWKLDRLGRSLKGLIGLKAELDKDGIDFVSLKDGIDTTTPAGRFTFHIFAAVAEFEKDQFKESTCGGLDAATARDRQGGRPKALTDAEVKKPGNATNKEYP